MVLADQPDGHPDAFGADAGHKAAAQGIEAAGERGVLHHSLAPRFAIPAGRRHRAGGLAARDFLERCCEQRQRVRTGRDVAVHEEEERDLGGACWRQDVVHERVPGVGLVAEVNFHEREMRDPVGGSPDDVGRPVGTSVGQHEHVEIVAAGGCRQTVEGGLKARGFVMGEDRDRPHWRRAGHG